MDPSWVYEWYCYRWFPLIKPVFKTLKNPYFWGGTVRGVKLTGHKTSKHQETRPVDHSEKTAVYQGKLFTVFEKFNHPL